MYTCDACAVNRDERRPDGVCPLPGCPGKMVARASLIETVRFDGPHAPSWPTLYRDSRRNLQAALVLNLVTCALLVLAVCLQVKP